MSDAYEAALKAGEIYHSVQIERNTKGYNWCIKVAGMDIEKIKERVVEVEKFCKDTYGNKD
jgi:succinyl-CoA synthetase beta subunit